MVKDWTGEDVKIYEEMNAGVREKISVTVKDVKQYGYTDRCKRCDFIRVHGHARGCYNAHSPACRLHVTHHMVVGSESGAPDPAST